MWTETLLSEAEYKTVLCDFLKDIGITFKDPYYAHMICDKISQDLLNDRSRNLPWKQAGGVILYNVESNRTDLKKCTREELDVFRKNICMSSCEFFIHRVYISKETCVHLLHLVDEILVRHPKIHVIKRTALNMNNENYCSTIIIEIKSLNDHIALLHYNAMKREVYAWDICAKRMGICSDIRLLISKIIKK
jgi:hypothetical protein